MSNEVPTAEKKSVGRLFVPSLALNGYAEQNLNLLLSLFLMDIAATFQVSVGIASQIGTISAIASIFAGLSMGVLSVRFNHKSLLMAGSVIIIVGLLGVYLAPNITFMQIFYPLDGIGSVIVVAMGSALIGRYLPLEKRAKAIGWMVASATLAFVIGALIVSFIPGARNWHSILLWFFLPVSVVGIVLAYFNVPSAPSKPQEAIGKEAYLNSFKKVLMNRSAAACFASTALFSVSQMWGLFAMTFYRTRFSVPLNEASLILLTVILTMTIGAVVGGRLVNRFGRKHLTILSLGLASVLMVIFVYMPYLWIVILLDLVSTFLRGMGFSAASNLCLEQVPQARGTMMSLNGMFVSLGAVIGITVGGIVLDQYGFLVLVPILGAFGIASVINNFIFVKDPIKK
ncbi:MFS transporter [Candidatus Bathyarchaeota archaeon]|nr:MFS transporter [Candidatus Bathyarchaeota archaeon]